MRHKTFITYEFNNNPDLKDFIQKVALDEGFDEKNAKYIIEGRIDGKIAGVVAYGDLEVLGITCPRFLHIIVHPDHRRSRFGVELMRASENCFRQLNKNIITAHIINTLPNREMKVKYALKFGYTKYFNTPEGELYVKWIKSKED